jgi:hypothetical protein
MALKTSIKAIGKLFLQLAAIYPYKFMGQFGDDPRAIKVAKGEWFAGLNDLSEADIDRGLNVCRKKGGEWPPSLPQFRDWCLPSLEELGVLDEHTAYQAFLRHDYSDPLVNEVKNQVDMYYIRLLPREQNKKEFLRVYRLVLDKTIPHHIAIPQSFAQLEYADD